jgi:hypothetical protein
MKGASSSGRAVGSGDTVHSPIRARWPTKLDQRGGQFSFGASKASRCRCWLTRCWRSPTPALPLLGVPSVCLSGPGSSVGYAGHRSRWGSKVVRSCKRWNAIVNSLRAKATNAVFLPRRRATRLTSQVLRSMSALEYRSVPRLCISIPWKSAGGSSFTSKTNRQVTSGPPVLELADPSPFANARHVLWDHIHLRRPEAVIV